MGKSRDELLWDEFEDHQRRKFGISGDGELTDKIDQFLAVKEVDEVNEALEDVIADAINERIEAYEEVKSLIPGVYFDWRREPHEWAIAATNPSKFKIDSWTRNRNRLDSMDSESFYAELMSMTPEDIERLYGKLGE